MGMHVPELQHLRANPSDEREKPRQNGGVPDDVMDALDDEIKQILRRDLSD